MSNGATSHAHTAEAAGKEPGGMHPARMIRAEDLARRAAMAQLSELPTRCAILRLPDAPVLDLRRARAVSAEKPPGNGLTMKMDYFASQAMQEYLQREITRHAEYADHEVCDAGFWDVDTSTDAGLGWHNDFNWNGFLRADNRSYHGWFVNSRTDDCNFTLAVSTDPRFNECNAAVRTKIFYVAGNDVIEPDIVVPLEPNTLILFPYGSAHRTWLFKQPDHLAGHRLVTSFVLHHKDDALDDDKIADLSDDELRIFLRRYPMEKSLGGGHYMVKLLERHPRTAPLVQQMLDSYFS